MEIELQQVSKSYGGGADVKRAVNSVSWRASGGEVFGLLGPNGAGKTSMIRMVLDIIRPDSGQILIDGQSDGNRQLYFKQRLGYLPEERGLYRKRKVMDILLYFAALKNVPKSIAKKRAVDLLERMELGAWAHKKIEDLSKGMSQKVQIASCMVHDPEMVVLDEPFSGLDPVNVRLVREIILELKAAGKLIFLSTHMMNEVEALCDRLFLIHQGHQVLYGSLNEIKKSYTDHEVEMDPSAMPENLPCVEQVRVTPHGKFVHLRTGKTVHDLIWEMGQQRRPFKRIQEATTPIEEIFVAVVTGKKVGHG